MGMKITLNPHGHVQRQLPLNTFGPLLGWKTGLLKEIHVARNAPDEPRLFHISIMNSKVNRLMGGATEPNLRAAGSGFTIADAFGRAAGEVVERYACCWYDPGEMIICSYSDLVADGLTAVHPEQFGLFSEDQYSKPGFPFVPFTEKTPVAWCKGTSLIDKRSVYFPSQLTYFGYEMQSGEHPIGYSTSSGCACSSDPAEALLKAICEQIERDAVMITWFAKLRPPQVDLSRFAADLTEFEQARLFGNNRRFEVRDITLDIPVPSFMGIAHLDVAGAERIFIGGAANVSASYAVKKALLEVGQGVPFIKTILIHNPDKQGMSFDNFDDNLRFYADERNTKYLSFLYENDSLSEVAPDASYYEPQAALTDLVSTLKRLGLEAIAIDHTTPDVAALGLHVARVYLPELVQLGVPALPFLGGSRLWDVPAHLGFPVEELNDMPHPYP